MNIVGIADSPTEPSQRDFWEHVGDEFPSLKGAPSTAYYLECEQRLFARFAPDLRAKRLLKTDLWDEAKNTEILRWAAEQGALPFGIDVAGATVRAARAVLRDHDPGLAIADVRELPFLDESFDVIYSMGTIEHFEEYRESVAELFRVLRPGGRAIIGVPNKLDPFLRPALVSVLNSLGLYSYGMEKSFTHNELRSLLETSGFQVVGESGVLFMPGWLRMVDLVAHVRRLPLIPVTRLLVGLFARAASRYPWLLRHGYLIAAVGHKPSVSPTSS